MLNTNLLSKRITGHVFDITQDKGFLIRLCVRDYIDVTYK